MWVRGAFVPFFGRGNGRASGEAVLDAVSLDRTDRFKWRRICGAISNMDGNPRGGEFRGSDDISP